MPIWFDYKGRKMMGGGLCLHTRREVLRQLLPQYRQDESAQKRTILDEFTQLTGYHRTYAMWLLNHTEEGQLSPVRSRPRQYCAEVQEALVQVWNAANRIAAKRLIPECLPLLSECQDSVLDALQHARERFPFPILVLQL